MRKQAVAALGMLLVLGFALGHAQLIGGDRSDFLPLASDRARTDSDAALQPPDAALALSPGLAVGGTGSRQTTGDGPDPNQPAADAEPIWSATIENRAEIVIRHRGVPVVTSKNVFWGERFAWAGPALKVTARSSQRVEFGGPIRKLGATVRGVAWPRPDRELRLEIQLDAATAHAGISGGGMAWVFQLDAPTLAGRAGVPELLEDRRGWRWAPAPGETILVRFDEPLAQLGFGPGGRKEVRTLYVGSRLERGSHRIGMTLQLPVGGRFTETAAQKYGEAETRGWFRGALRWDTAPVDLSFLNAQDRPAGRRGPVKARGELLVFEDGSPARFWGTNLAAAALFETPRELVPTQARRLAQLGYNLIRIHHHDAQWIRTNVFGTKAETTRQLDPKALDRIDWWIKCLKDEGIYIWLDLHASRQLRDGDGISQGFDEIERRSKGSIKGWNYLNPDVTLRMREFQKQYLSHLNPYTRLTLKDDPAVIGILITNENDLTHHYGNHFLPNKNTPVHRAWFSSEAQAFARATGLPGRTIEHTWKPGPSKYFLNELEHRFNRVMISDLRSLGVAAPISTTSYWGKQGLYALPALTDGDVIDVHSYGVSEALSSDPRHQANFISWIAAAQVQGMPLSITEWNVPHPEIDRFTSPLYVASIAALQGWDAPMLYNYSQLPLRPPGSQEWTRRVDKWSTAQDPALTGVMPAAAVAFRQGHIRPARFNYCLRLTPQQLLNEGWSPDNAATIRTLAEMSRLTIAMPRVQELPWLQAREPSGDEIVVTDPNRDFLPPGQSFVQSDTGELKRDWTQGIQTIDTPLTQAVGGWIGGKVLELKDSSFVFTTPKAVVCLTSLDQQPLASSRFILITAIGRAQPSGPEAPSAKADERGPQWLPFLSEPVVGTVRLRTNVAKLELLCLDAQGRVATRLIPDREGEHLSIRLPAGAGTHWYLLKAPRTEHP